MHIAATGMVCPVGLNGPAACAALRAGISGFAELPFWDTNAKPIIGAAVPGLDLKLSYRKRIVALLAIALQDCLARTPRLRLARIPLLVGLAEPNRPGADEWSAEDTIAHLERQLAVGFHPDHSGTIASGHTAGFEALRLAQDLLQRPDIEACLVCGADSYINAGSLFWLDSNWRLKREGHTDGVIPGEAAAAVLVRRHATTNNEVTTAIIGLGFGQEGAVVLGEAPLQAQGLADACNAALLEAGWGFHDLDFRMSDVTGENYGFRELALAEGRVARAVRSEPQPLWHAADTVGDTGAAAGVIQLVTATTAWTKSYAPGPRAGCFTSSIHGGRAVALLQSVELGGG